MRKSFIITIGVAIIVIIAGCVALLTQRKDSMPTPTTEKTTAQLTVLAAGDISSCQNDNDEETAKILDQYRDATILTLGDNAYDSGKISEYLECYEPTRGRHKDRTYPVIGNHDYGVPGAEGYYSYFKRTQPGYYSFDKGPWHFISLDSNCSITPCAAGSEQETWLRTDLANQPDDKCVLAYMHHPRVSSADHGNNDDVEPLWEALNDYGADVVLSGHDHTYERFAPLNPDGSVASERGVHSFVVGTGGKGHYKFTAIKDGSLVRNSTDFGVLKLTLEQSGYTWDFLPVSGGTFTDTGSATCH